MSKMVVSVWALLAIGAAPAIWSEAAAQEFTTVDIQSQAYSGSRPIAVHLPVGYTDESRSYPVLYVLNEQENALWAADIVDFLSGRAIDKMIVVGLPSQGNYGGDNYPFAGPGSEPNEGATAYASFLQSEVIPYIDANYRTEDSRFIVGHSLSGLFVTNLFLTDPDAFNLSIIVSPSFHQAPQIVDLMREKLGQADVADGAGAVYMTIGGLEHALIQEGYARMREVFETQAPEGLVWASDTIAYDNHRATAYAGLYAGLSWAYRGWGSQEAMAELGVDGVIAHYDELSETLGYAMVPAEGDFAGLGGFLLNRRNNPDGAAVAFNVELHYYPGSEEARAGLAEATAARPSD